jgi:hypothetical protein
VATGAIVGNPEVPRGADGRVMAAVEADVAAVTVGDCVNLPTEGDDETITTVDIVPCSLPHQVEKYAEVVHPAGAVNWIGTTAIEEWATDACAGEFEAVFGRPSEEVTHLRFSFVYPAPQAWATGDRLVQCFVMRADQAPLVGPLGVDAAG